MSPDNTRVLFVTQEYGSGALFGNNKLLVYDVPSGIIETIATSIPEEATSFFCAQWSPRSDAIAFVASDRLSFGHVVVHNLDAGSETIVSPENHCAYGPQLSPDGKHVAYLLFEADAHLGRPFKPLLPGISSITESGEWVTNTIRLHTFPGRIGGIGQLVWSGDASALVFSATEVNVDSRDGPVAGIFRYILGAESVELLHQDVEVDSLYMNPVFINDNRGIAYVVDSEPTVFDSKMFAYRYIVDLVREEWQETLIVVDAISVSDEQ